MYLILDSETSGLPITEYFNMYNTYTDNTKYNSSRLVQLSWQVLNEQLKQVCFRDYIIKRDNFDIGNSHIHGITNEISDNGHLLNDVLDILKSDLETCTTLVAHNLLFDYNIILNHCFRNDRHEIIASLLQKNKYCTGQKSTNLLKIKMKYSNYKMPKLSELYYYFFKKEIENAHNAAADVDACSKCFVELKKIGI